MSHWKEEVLCEKAFLYSLWQSHTLRVYEGLVKRITRNPDWNYGELHSVETLFECDETKKVYSLQKSSYTCADKEGQVYNKMVWLSSRDDRRAKDIFIEYEEREIKKLEARIDSHRRIIEFLKE